MTPLGALLAPELSTLLLELARISGLMVTSPVPFEAAPRQVKVATVILLALVAHGLQTPVNIELSDPLAGFLYVVVEFLVGLAMGLVVRFVFAAAEVAGSTLAPVMGFGAAQVFDPATGQQDSVLARFFRQLAILLALAVGLHRVVVGALLKSFVVLPVGTPLRPSQSAEALIRFSSQVVLSGVRLALPALAVLLMAQVALGFIARAAPAMQIFNIGFTVLICAGAILIWLTLPDIGAHLLDTFARVARQIESVLSLMVVS